MSASLAVLYLTNEGECVVISDFVCAVVGSVVGAVVGSLDGDLVSDVIYKVGDVGCGGALSSIDVSSVVNKLVTSRTDHVCNVVDSSEVGNGNVDSLGEFDSHGVTLKMT